jgi:hypothetical protein
MKARIFTLFAATLMIMALAAVTQALPSQTYVASTGNDANDCTQITPCRTFAGAVPKTTAKGIITALDSSAYGIVTIDKGLTIQAAPGVSAVLEGSRSDDVVTINAGATSVVTLRNLHIMSRTLTENNGVVINAVGTLHVENCLITGFGGAGLRGPGSCEVNDNVRRVFLLDSIFRDNITGLKTGCVKALADHCRFEHGHVGIEVGSVAQMVVRDCVLDANSDVGLKVEISGRAMIENCAVTNNGTGIQGNQFMFGVSITYVSSTLIFSNVVGLLPKGGLMFSFGNNRLGGNTTNGSFTPGPIPQQ